MKYGERLEEASVPGWSLHNVDYNSLKHQIKVHTTKDQATTAIAIPGQQDDTLKRFEDRFYLELRSQHDHVGLFVTSKADEVSRRLRHLSSLVHQLMLKCTDTRGLSTKRQQRFVKYQARIEECGQDIKALGRFVDAQVTAFRKILKKYKKWTGSTTLSSRFKENVLASPKSFTNYNFAPLQLQHQELRATLEAASPFDTNMPEPRPTESRNNSSRRSRRSSHSTTVTTTMTPTAYSYWNEYEHSSEVGEHDDDNTYVIYINPNADDEFPGLAYLKNMFGAPVNQVRHWLKSQKSKDVSSSTQTIAATSPSETQSLLGALHNSRTNTGSSIAAASSPTDYFSIGIHHPCVAMTNNEPTEDESLFSEEGGELHHHYPHSLGFFPSSSSSAADYKIEQYQDKVLTRGVVIAFVAAFVLFGISSLLFATGRHHLRLEVDAGATVGSAASLFCACMGLGAMLYRQYPSGYLYSLAVWTAFMTMCVLNGMLLVLVVGSSGL
ncbi:hypothetical protein HD806DRAFT_437998 [Xylariaceae sp. AK1471]|nr:hypothetical protein HD806DRAFT_437998 [Xylariaceae sp. AK1471]